MPLNQLIYTSTAADELSEEELGKILAVSVQNNRDSGITGMLLHCRGTFLQVLEGKEAALDAAFGRISLDSRHRELVVIDRTPILRRSFGDWTMGFHSCTELDIAALPGYTNILKQGFRASELVQDPNSAKDILHKFARGLAVV